MPVKPRTLAERLETAADVYCDAKARAMDKLRAAAQAFAKAETLAYSAAHPRRTVTFCAAMGSTTLHVSRDPRRGEYQFSADPFVSDRGTPEFMRTLGRIEDETEDGKGWLAGPLLFECKGGRVVRDLTDW